MYADSIHDVCWFENINVYKYIIRNRQEFSTWELKLDLFGFMLLKG